MSRLLANVRNVPLPPIPEDATPTCPFCSSLRVRVGSTTSTLVGYFGRDFNHKWTECLCKDCQREFTWEVKGDNEWYTLNGIVLKGVPSCFENYAYACNQCSGLVRRVGDPSGITILHELVPGELYTPPSYAFSCDSCSHSFEAEHEWGGHGSVDDPTPRIIPERKPLGWTVTEKVGGASVNRSAISKLSLSSDLPSGSLPVYDKDIDPELFAAHKALREEQP